MPTATTNALVGELLGRTLTAAEQSRADQLILWAEASISAKCRGLTFGETDGESVTLYGDGDDVLWIPKYPVRAVTSVTVGGALLASGDYRVTQLGELRRKSSSVASSEQLEPDYGLRWPDGGTTIVITYNYGFASGDVPSELQLTATDLAASRFVNPDKVSQQSIGDRSVSFAGNAGSNAGAISDFHMLLLRDWNRTSVMSLRQRTR